MNPIKEEFEATFLDGDKINDCGGAMIRADDVWPWIGEKIIKAQKDTAQQCYLECLAVECGEGECARAIRTKFNLSPQPDKEKQ